MERPRIAGAYRPWFKPAAAGNYVNDHCIVRKDGAYHLFGITSRSARPADERYFVHAAGKSLQSPLAEMGVSIDRGTLAWSPCVTEHGGDYYMIYGPSPTSLSVSPDLYEWFNYPLSIQNEPLYAFHRDHFVLRLEDGGYLLYASGIQDRRGCISAASSRDLIHWKFEGYALTSAPDAPLRPAWGAMESPFVVRRGGLYYLFVTYTDSSDATYNDTLVFVSGDPLHFGCYLSEAEPARLAARLYAHAPEIICESGKSYITTCGWIGKPNPNPGCVSIAPLEWE